METIYKYELSIFDKQVLTLPKGHKILSLQVQKNIPCIWVLLDHNSNDMEKIEIITIGTGLVASHVSNPNVNFINTYQLEEGFVFHVFSRKL